MEEGIIDNDSPVEEKEEEKIIENTENPKPKNTRDKFEDWIDGFVRKYMGLLILIVSIFMIVLILYIIFNVQYIKFNTLDFCEKALNASKCYCSRY